MVAAAAHMVVQTSWERFVAALVSGLFDVYTTVRRAPSRHSRPEFDGWAMS